MAGDTMQTNWFGPWFGGPGLFICIIVIIVFFFLLGAWGCWW